MVRDVRQAEKAIGIVNYGATEAEQGSLAFRRSIFVTEDIPAGGTLTPENIRVIRPSNGLKPKYYEEVLGKTALQEIKRGTPLSWELISK